MGVHPDDPGCLTWRGSHQLSLPPPNPLRGDPSCGSKVTRNLPGRSRHVHYMSSTCISWLRFTSKAPAIPSSSISTYWSSSLYTPILGPWRSSVVATRLIRPQPSERRGRPADCFYVRVTRHRCGKYTRPYLLSSMR